MSLEEFLIIEGYMRLFNAIKVRAEKDRAVGDFVSYWYYSSELVAIWREISSEVGAVINFS